MNLKARLQSIAHLLTKDRQVGYTTLTAKTAKELGATMLTHSFAEARRIERNYGVPAKSVDVNQVGSSDFFVIDQFAVANLLNRAAARIEELETELEEIQENMTLQGLRAVAIKRSLKKNDGDLDKVAREFFMTKKALYITMKSLGIT